MAVKGNPQNLPPNYFSVITYYVPDTWFVWIIILITQSSLALVPITPMEGLLF